MTSKLDIGVVNFRKNFAVLTDGRTVPITHWIDEDGEDTDDQMEAVAFVAGSDETGWFSERVCDYDPLRVS